MSIFQAVGRYHTVWMKLSVTTPVAFSMDGGNNGIYIDSIHIANTGVGTPNITIDAYDTANTTAYVIVQELSLAAAGTESTELGIPKSTYDYTIPFFLSANWALRVTSTVAGSVVHCALTHVHKPGRS